MQKTKVEGLLISKYPFGERHLMGKLLLRSGRHINICFYGGRGGGKKSKSSILELGFMLKVELQRSRKTSDVYQAKEWELIWHHRYIRQQMESFSVLCLMLEVVGKLAEESELEDDEFVAEHSGGTFRSLSNALFYYDQVLEKKDGGQRGHQLLALFLAKLLVEQGVLPNLSQCVLSGTSLNESGELRLLIDQGGFAFTLGLDQSEGAIQQNDRDIWYFLANVSQTKFQELLEQNFETPMKPLAQRLFFYFCYQFQFSENDFKSFKSVF